MKALSLWQPWASLIAEGHKKIETRSWVTNYRGTLAIHAAKKVLPVSEWPGLGILLTPDELPYGAIIAVAVLYEVESTNVLLKTQRVTPMEKRFGDFSLNRYGWRLTDVKKIRPLALRGMPGVFALSSDVVAEIRRRIPQ